MKLSLRSKLSISYAMIILLIVGLTSLFAGLFLERQFRSYLIDQQASKNQQIVDLLARHYQEDGEFSKDVVATIGLSALDQGMMLRITDSSSRVIWDAFVYNHALCVAVISRMEQNTFSRYPGFPGGYVEDSYPIRQGSVQVGTVDIGYYGPFFLTDADLGFISAVNMTLLASGGISLVLALILGATMAKRISQPIAEVIRAAERLSQGDSRGRIAQRSTTKEIAQLTETVNVLANTLEQQERLRRRLTGDVAHELRTPLATLQSHMEAMIDGVWAADQARLTSCHEEIVRLARLVGDLERLARYEGDNLSIDRTDCQLGQLAERAIQTFAAAAEQKEVKLSLTGPNPVISADQDKITQVLVNLLDNALKYTPAGGKIDLVLAEANDDVQISVRDSGAGISSADLPHVFQRFYRADQSRNRLTGGSGIGLAIVKAIVEAHNGSVTARSRLGEGSEFIVTLPKNMEERCAAQRQ